MISGIYNDRYFNVDINGIIIKSNNDKKLPETPVVYLYSGDYNSDNAKMYIGSTQNAKKRNYNHLRLLNKGHHDNEYFQYAWSKYGSENFKYFVLEECNKEEIRIREQNWIDYYSSKYGFEFLFNFDEIVEQPFYGKKHSPKTKKIISDKAEERFKNEPGTFTGLKHTEQSLKKMREYRIGKKSTKESLEKIKKTSILRGNYLKTKEKWSIPVRQLDLHDKMLFCYPSAANAQEVTKIDRSSISRNIKGKCPHAGFYKWEKISKEEYNEFMKIVHEYI